MKHLHIYQLNDLHSHFENWPKIRRYLLERKAYHEERGEDVLLFDIGDFLDRVHPLTEATDGQANIELLNTVPFDAVTIGNNEGIGNSKSVLNRLYRDANFPVVLANLFDPETDKPPHWAKRCCIKTMPSGIRVGLIGLTSPLYLSYIPNGWDPKEAYEVLPQLIQELKPKVDIIILLSHMGIIEDTQMAEMYQEIPLILGAHTHHVLPEGRLVEGTLLTGAGKWGRFIGHVTLTLTDDFQIAEKRAGLIECDRLPEREGDWEEVEHLYRLGEELLSEDPVANVPFTLKTDWQRHTRLVDLGLNAITQYANVPVGILHSGLFLDDLPEGLVTKQTLHHILPHPMRLLTCTMKGKTFSRMIQGMEQMRDALRQREVAGMGFRGKIFGELCYKGITLDAEGTVRVLGNPIRTHEDITFVTVDHYRYVSFFPLIENEGENELLFPYFLRDVVGQYLEERYPLTKTSEAIE